MAHSSSDSGHGDLLHLLVFVASIAHVSHTLDSLFFVGVGSPEASQELLLLNVLLSIDVESLEEHFELLITETKLEAVHCIFKLLKAYGTGVVCVNQVKRLLNRFVILHKVITDALEQTTLPLIGVLLVLFIQSLLHTLKSIVNLQIVQLVSVRLVHAKDSGQKGLLVLIEHDSVVEE